MAPLIFELNILHILKVHGYYIYDIVCEKISNINTVAKNVGLLTNVTRIARRYLRSTFEKVFHFL